jgi:hypothetical protein
VENYPLIPRSLEELENIRHIIERRRIETAEKKLRRQILTDGSIGHDANSDTPLVKKTNRIFNSFFIDMSVNSVKNPHPLKMKMTNLNKHNNRLLYSVLLGKKINLYFDL